MSSAIRFIGRWLLLGAVSLSFSRPSQAQTKPPGPLPGFNTVKVEAVDALARETGDNTGFAFRISRTGSTDHPVRVFYTLEGTARDRLDYQGPLNAAGEPPLDAIPGPMHLVTIPEGKEAVDLQFRALADDLVEPDETVIAQIVPSPLSVIPTPENSYDIAPEPVAKAVIEDTTDATHARITLTKPEAGTQFTAPAEIELAATATDPNGAIYRVEFHAGDRQVVVSEILTLVAIPPGTPVQHTAVWKDAPAGRYELHAKAVDAQGNKVVSASVPIVVVGEPEALPVVTITTKDGEAVETDGANIGIFRLNRTGDTAKPLTVLFSTHGSAGRGVDYVLIPESMFIPCPACLRPEIIITGDTIEIPAGEHSVLIGVRGFPDKALEGSESVVLRVELVPVPEIVGARPPYLVGQPAEARVTLLDDSIPDGGLVIHSPENGATFTAPADIAIRLTAQAADGLLTDITLWANGQKLGDAQFCAPEARCLPPQPGQAVLHSFQWNDVPADEYALTAVGKSTSGREVKSATVHIKVNGGDEGRIVLVAKGSDWSFLDTGVAPGDGWTESETDAALWKNGPAQLGYGDGDEATVVSYGPDKEAKFITTWFRRSFDVGDLTALKALRLHLLRDDGAVVYLNGVEVFRSNLPDGPITPTTLASTTVGEDENKFIEAEVPLSALKQGANVVAVEIHQANVTSSDISFDLVLVGLTTEPPKPASIVIKAPAAGSQFTAPAVIPITAEAIDPAGHILHVAFFANEQKIGESTLAFKLPPPPGTPLEHHFEWQNAPAGAYNLRAIGEAANGQRVVSAAVRVIVKRAPEASVVLTSPKPGDRFWEPATISLKAVAKDPDSYVDHVDFYANERRIGESTVVFIVPPEPGSPIEHEFEWKGVLAGNYTLYAVGKSADGTETKGGTVRIKVEEALVIPAVTIEAVEPETSEPRGRELTRPAVFALRRTGPAERPLKVFYEVGGTATNGKDYVKLDGDATFAAGEHERRIQVWPLPDRLVERRESVVVELKEDRHYVAAEPRRAVVHILDADTPDHPTLVITAPDSGATFAVGAEVEVKALAIDPAGYLPDVEFTANDEVIGTSVINFLVAPEPGTPIEHSIVWKPTTPGEFAVRARTTTAAGLAIVSEPVKVVITRPDPVPVAVRELPDHFVPGTAFTVTLRTTPPAGTQSFGLEDQPPRGWAVSEISSGGAFDPTTGKVKFGPFFDTDPRTLTYLLTPPASTEHIRYEFSGIASADGVNSRIGGDRIVTAQLNHPADREPVDFRMTLAEVTAYGAAWKTGAEWPLPPNPIPVDYVTRAGALWKGGEAYQFDANAEPAPLWWVNVPVAESPVAAEAAGLLLHGPHRHSVAVVEYILPADPAQPIEVRIRVLPVASVLNYAIEERLPLAGAVTEISDGGVLDATAGVIRWGPFFDAEARTLRFLLKPDAPLSLADVRNFLRPGTASFDGRSRPLHRLFRPAGPRPHPDIVDNVMLGDGSVQLLVLDDAGEPASVLEVSSDLNVWKEVSDFEANGEAAFGLDTDADETVVRFYRAKRRSP